jgi:hypothetical protein
MTKELLDVSWWAMTLKRLADGKDVVPIVSVESECDDKIGAIIEKYKRKVNAKLNYVPKDAGKKDDSKFSFI